MIHKIVTPVFNTVTVHGKCYLLNRDNLTQQIQMQLSEKQKSFSEFFFGVLKSLLDFKHLSKKDDLEAEIFPEITARRIWLHKCLKSRVSEDH